MPGRSTQSLDLTAMSPSHAQLREIERSERWRTLRNWALGLSALSFFLAMCAVGFVGLGNPKYVESTALAFAGAGFVRWAVIPMLAASIAFAVVGALMHGLSRRRAGEV